MAEGEVFISKTATGRKHLNTLVQSACRIRLFCRFMTPLGKAPYRVTMEKRSWTGEADENGWIEIRSWEGNEKCHLEWSHPKEGEAARADGGGASGPSAEQILASYETDAKAEVIGDLEYVYETDLYLDLKDGDEQEEALRRLHNLGYAPDGELADKVRAFQRVYRKSVTGVLGDVVDELFEHHDGCKPTKWPSGRDALWSKYA